MGWPRVEWRRESRIKASVVDIAASVAEAIVESTNVLRAHLEAEGLGRTTPELVIDDEVLLECTLFECFLHEAVVILEFGRHAEAIRQALAGRLLIELCRSGVSVGALTDFGRRWVERFPEYAEATAAGESLQALGSLACLRIFGRAEASERGTMLLARRASAKLAALRGF